MTATKLRELLEAASPGGWTLGDNFISPASDRCLIVASEYGASLAFLNIWEDDPATGRANAALITAAPDLARLVLELSEALDHEMMDGAEAAPVQDTDGRCYNCKQIGEHTAWCGWGALAAVEELEL